MKTSNLFTEIVLFLTLNRKLYILNSIHVRMWIAKIKLRHDCLLGNRCKKFNVILQSYDLNEEIKNKKILTSSLHQIVGSESNIKKFIADLKKDKRVSYLEFDGNTMFLAETAKGKPVSHFTRKMFFVKPVVIDSEGYEYWEIASHKRNELEKFISGAEKISEKFELLCIRNTKLKYVYFPKVLPQLTFLQKQALELAIKNGYYLAPKKIGLRALARLMNISLATYQQHLQSAESKIMPDILSYLK